MIVVFPRLPGQRFRPITVIRPLSPMIFHVNFEVITGCVGLSGDELDRTFNEFTGTLRPVVNELPSLRNHELLIQSQILPKETALLVHVVSAAMRYYYGRNRAALSSVLLQKLVRPCNLEYSIR